MIRPGWSKLTLIAALVAAILVSSPQSASADLFLNQEDIAGQLNFESYYQGPRPRRTLRVAVLDNGFSGYLKEIGKSLPRNTVYHEGSVQADTDDQAKHGLAMAQILTAFVTDGGQREDLMPELHLYDVSGFTNFKEAIDDIVSRRMDVVLHSMVRDYGGNFDGGGLFNHQVNRAIDAGVIWVNAAGNFAKTTYNLDSIETEEDNWLRLPGPNQALPIRCKPISKDIPACQVRIVLSWNDFKNDENQGTDKDLDLVLTDDTLSIVQTSNLSQVQKDASKPGTTLYPREIINATLKPGRYFVRVKNRSLNFGRGDRARIVADGEFIELEHSSARESILNPADNPRVITVGASDSDRSSSSVKLNKPDFILPSKLELADGRGQEAFLGSSNAAAIAAAGIALLIGEEPNMPATEVLNRLSSARLTGKGLELEQLGFKPENGRCFAEEKLKDLPPHLQDVIDLGGVFVKTTLGLRIVTPFDPIRLTPRPRRIRPDDMVNRTPTGWVMASANQRGLTPDAWAEVFELPRGMGMCEIPESWRGLVPQDKTFRLP